MGDEQKLEKKLSTISVWALAFGCIIGWGAFVMPGETFLMDAGPLGTLIGMILAIVVMSLISINYNYMVRLYPVAGGEFKYTQMIFGDKHAYISKNFENKKDFISLFMKNVQFVESYDDIEDDILKFSIASFDDQMEQRIEKIQKQLKPHLKLVTTGNVWFDIFYKDVNKGTTLTHLLEILKIKPEESGAFGDQMNDYEMLQTVKYGYAMANAMPPVKEVAYQVIDSNENDGVILKIKEILKGKC